MAVNQVASVTRLQLLEQNDELRNARTRFFGNHRKAFEKAYDCESVYWRLAESGENDWFKENCKRLCQQYREEMKEWVERIELVEGWIRRTSELLEAEAAASAVLATERAARLAEEVMVARLAAEVEAARLAEEEATAQRRMAEAEIVWDIEAAAERVAQEAAEDLAGPETSTAAVVAAGAQATLESAANTNSDVSPLQFGFAHIEGLNTVPPFDTGEVLGGVDDSDGNLGGEQIQQVMMNLAAGADFRLVGIVWGTSGPPSAAPHDTGGRNPDG